MGELMSRNFGMSSRETAGGFSQSRGSHHAPNTTQRNSNSIPPLPAQSLRDEPVILDSDREIGATVFVIGFYAFILGSLYAVIKFLE